MRRFSTLFITSIFSATCLSGQALAGGQFVGDNGSQGMQRAGAFAAKADDATALYYNPAALARLEGRQFFLGANLIDVEQTFDRAGAYGPVGGVGPQPDYVGDDFPTVSNQSGPQAIPFFALAFPGESLSFALGVFAPHAFGNRDFADTVDTNSGTGAPAPQRYDTVEQSALLALPSAALAFRVSDRLTVGARASYGFATLSSRRSVQGLPNANEDPGQDSDVRVEARDDRVLAFGAGLHYQHSERVELALVYAAPIRIHAVGTSESVLGPAIAEPLPGMTNEVVPVPDAMAQCAPGGEPGAIKTCIDLAMPQTATAGIRYVARDDVGREIGDVELDVRWEDWSAVSDYLVVADGMNSLLGDPLAPSVTRHGFQDVYSIRAGGASRFERGGTPYELRAGSPTTPPRRRRAGRGWTWTGWRGSPPRSGWESGSPMASTGWTWARRSSTRRGATWATWRWTTPPTWTTASSPT